MNGMRMDMSIGLKQQLKLSPQMIHSMEVLQLPQQLLDERIDKELTENPFLERKEHLAQEKPTASQLTPDGETFNPNKPLESDPDNQLDFQRLERFDRDLNLGGEFSDEFGPSRARGAELSDQKQEAIANIADRQPSLQDHLTEQLGYLDITPEERERVEYLIYNLDERGYLASTLDELAIAYGQPATMDAWEASLEKLQELDPSGIGARDLQECLYSQIQLDTPFGDVMRLLIRSHLEDIQHNRLPVIQKATNLPLEAIRQGILALRTLNPRPSAGFETTSTHYVTPDIILEKNEETGEYTIKLTDDRQPRVFLNRRYMEMYRTGNFTEKERQAMHKNLMAAQLLLNSIDQRKSTLEKVARAIVNHQKQFLDRGADFIIPLKMQEIADQVKVHVTTISRAVADKWIQTPRGMFPLKRFFGGGKKNDETGEDVAYEKIKQRLQEFIGKENKSSPLSDEDIVELFSADGLKVARRTVTKYRKLMNIPSSRQRKQWAG
jgi:RNA polymerase sigma-54 factor